MIGYLAVSLFILAMVWNKKNERGLMYYALNSAGALLLLVYSANNADAPVFILSIVLLAVSMDGLYSNT